MSNSNSIASDTRQELALIRVYNGYRTALALLLLTTYLVSPMQRLVGTLYGDLFLYTVVIYLLANLATALLLALRHESLTPWQTVLHIALDLLALLLMTHASGGVTSGLALLLLVSVAAGAIQLRGQFVLLIAALATLGLLFSSGYLIASGLLPSRSLLPTGLMGGLFFATALLIASLAQRIRSTQQLARSRAEDVRQLLELNQQIVRRMRTGVLVVGPACELRMLNQSARELLHIDDQPASAVADAIVRILGPDLARWQQHSTWQPPPLRSSDTGPELLIRYTPLSEHGGGDTLVFVEDHGQVTQRAQQLKLASLGRLTASIAHEIRNPLGAISHAAQLLLESADLPPSDRRLGEIVHHHSRRMNGIIENVLQLSRRRTPSLQRLTLDAWLAEVCASFQQSHPEARLQIDGNAACVISADPDQLQQVLINLLENAIRCSTRASGVARARLVVHRIPQTGLWALDVVDDGPGVDDSDREKIFEPFFTTEKTGSGLGLYLARELCEINQARLDPVRTPAGHSAFRISFAHADRKPLAEYRLQEEA